MNHLLRSLVVASEKAANIARSCRQDPHLFGLLVEEKCAGEANPRFAHDFKTLADVLIQETLRHDVGLQFAELKGFIRGEESNTFRNKLGETIDVEVLSSEAETKELLTSVLNGDVTAAALLAREVHRKLDVTDVNAEGIPDDPDEDVFDVSALGIWIDPIDSTSEYISGSERRDDDRDIVLGGLRCVTVLIGVYHRLTGEPVMGVVNQPFYKNESGGAWRGKCYWGSNAVREAIAPKPTNNRQICVSGSEDASVRTKLVDGGYELVEAAGAGYKLLLVVLGSVDAYVLTRSSTFKWDTCAPQAILNRTGGGLVVWERAVQGEVVPIDYKEDVGVSTDADSKIDKYCNRGGIIAYRNADVLDGILEAFAAPIGR